MNGHFQHISILNFHYKTTKLGVRLSCRESFGPKNPPREDFGTQWISKVNYFGFNTWQRNDSIFAPKNQGVGRLLPFWISAYFQGLWLFVSGRVDTLLLSVIVSATGFPGFQKTSLTTKYGCLFCPIFFRSFIHLNMWAECLVLNASNNTTSTQQVLVRGKRSHTHTKSTHSPPMALLLHEYAPS